MTVPSLADSAVGNLIQFGGFVLLFIGQVASLLLFLRNSARANAERVTATALAKQAADAAVGAVTSELTRLTATVERIAEKHEAHELDCTGWRGRADEKLSQLAANGAATAQALEGMQRQITNVALGIAPSSEAVLIPATRPSRARR